MANKTTDWLREHSVVNVEMMTADYAGLPRGKLVPAQEFADALGSDRIRFPASVYCVTVHGDFVEYEGLEEIETELDLIFDPLLDTLTLLPDTPGNAAVICNARYRDGGTPEYAPRQVLQNVLDLYQAQGMHPKLAPEFEFFLLAENEAGNRALDHGPYGLESVAACGPFFDALMAWCERTNIGVRTLIREAGRGQFEASVDHTNPLEAADKAFLFRSAVRRLARAHGHTASFMARPVPGDFGSAMHIHQSIEDDAGNNLFAAADGSHSPLFLNFIGGLQKHAADATALFAPYANSYLRFGSDLSAPANSHWGEENRSVGLRVPHGSASSRRLENRIPGADANPYLAIAASLACGYLGMRDNLEPSQPVDGSAYARRSRLIPGHLVTALERLGRAKALADILGEHFVNIFIDIKRKEFAAQMQSLSTWERTHLLDNV